MDRLLGILKALADRTRLRILLLLAEGELTVSEIVDILDQSQPRVSRHLKLMLEAGLVCRVQEATWVFYRLSSAPDVLAIIEATSHSADRADPGLKADLDGLQAIRKARFDTAQAYFDANAEHWSEVRALYVASDAVEDRLRARLKGLAFDRLVDIGTGTGRMLDLFAPQAREAIGVDVNRDMLALARGSLSGPGFAHVHVRQGDMYALPLETGSANCILIHQVLHYADDPASVIAEAARVMAPGGILIVVDFAPHDEEHLRERHQHRRLGFSNSEIIAFAEASGLVGGEVEHVSGEPLTVTIWTFRASGEVKQLERNVL